MDRVIEDRLCELSEGHDRPEGSTVRLGQEQGGRVHAKECPRALGDLLQHRSQVQVGGDLAAEFRERRHLQGAAARLLVQSSVGDRRTHVRGERGEQPYIGLVEATLLCSALHADDPDGPLAVQDGDTEVRLRLRADPALSHHVPIGRLAQQQRFAVSQDLRGQAAPERHRGLCLDPAAFAVIRELDHVGIGVVERDVHDVGRKGLAHLLTDELDQRAQLQLRAQRLADLVDDRELGRLAARLLEQPRVLEGDAEACSDGRQQSHVSLAEGALAVQVLERDDASRHVADD